jgi:hypothetical protein
VTVAGEFARALGRQADAVFVILDFLGAADEHGVEKPFAVLPRSLGCGA